MKTTAEIMNRSFFHVAPTDTIAPVLHQMAERGLGSAPVLDLAGHPLGAATAREIESFYDVEELTEHLKRPVVCMHQNTPIDVAARTLALHQSDTLVLVNDHGIAVGAATALDLLRATLGLNGSHGLGHPQDRATSWDDAEYLELGAAHRAPEAPGIILLSPGLDPNSRRIVWAEAASNMRERLDQMLRNPQENSRLEAMLDAYPRTLRFRCLTEFDSERRERLAEALSTMSEARSESGIRSIAPEVAAYAKGAADKPAQLAKAD
jgi:CBS domain-containing protein